MEGDETQENLAASIASKPPIIYCHFGNSFYLEFVLSQAIKNCPGRDVILLGDASNLWLKKTGVKHELLEKYLGNSMALEAFNESFKLTGGSVFLDSINKSKTIVSGVSTCWTKFNFLKWIGLYEYLRGNEIEHCWFFDSDMLVISDPAKTEDVLLARSLKWTYWNDLHQHQGWIGDPSIIDSFVKHFIYLFRDKTLIQKLEETDFMQNPSWGFTLMRAWNEFHRRQDDGHSEWLQKMIPDSLLVYLDGTIENELYSLVRSRHRWQGRPAKEVFYDRKGSLFARLEGRDGFLPITFLNLSWADPELVSLIRRTQTVGSMSHYGLRSVDELKKPRAVTAGTRFWRRIRTRIIGHTRKGF
jgi:hypothetical protein